MAHLSPRTVHKRNRKTKIKPPFGYFGSKYKIALTICENLPPHSAWVELFCGSASVTLAKKPSPIEIINDLDDQIINFFDTLRNQEEALCRAVALTPYARTELYKARKKEKNISSLEKARRFLITSMMAVNGLFGEHKGGFSFSSAYSREGREARVNRWYNLPPRLEAVAERLRNVRIENMDALELFKMFLNRPATLVYLDPPYLGERSNGYNLDIKDEKFHIDLLKLANQAKCMVLISGYENELYKKILLKSNGWSVKKISTHTKTTSGKTFKRTEILWRNRHFTKALTEKKIPITLTKHEKNIYKINPAR